jgi:hypothetical protein
LKTAAQRSAFPLLTSPIVAVHVDVLRRVGALAGGIAVNFVLTYANPLP